MSHQCVRCGIMYGDGSKELLSGCSNCGSKFFFFISKKAIEKAKQLTVELTQESRKEIEIEITGIIEGKTDLDSPIFVDIESIRVLEKGKYELNLVDLFKGKPLIYKLEDGKYIIDLVSTFEAKEY